MIHMYIVVYPTILSPMFLKNFCSVVFDPGSTSCFTPLTSPFLKIKGDILPTLETLYLVDHPWLNAAFERTPACRTSIMGTPMSVTPWTLEYESNIDI